MNLIYHSSGIWYTHAANQTTPMEDSIMKKVFKSILNARNCRENQARPDTGKARCYACINGIIIPVL